MDKNFTHRSFSSEEGLLFLYQDALDSLRQFKDHQWKVAYYGVSLNAGLFVLLFATIGLEEIKENDKIILSVALFLLSFSVTLILSILLFKLQCALERKRKNLCYIQERMPRDFKCIWSFLWNQNLGEKESIFMPLTMGSASAVSTCLFGLIAFLAYR